MVNTVAAVVLSLAASALAQNASPVCGPSAGGAQCPQDSPCCSTYGQCGVGAYCLGGCDPSGSFNLQSCMPAPVCQSSDYKMNSLDDISPNTKYLGDASKANWVSSGTPVAYQNEAVLLTMAPSTVGTLLTSTHYVWYGKISATMTTSQGDGVVTAFILMSGVHDEIDFEFVGDDVSNAQSNYYWQGVTNYDNMVKLSVDNTRSSHTYEIDWQPDTLTWSIDGNVMRTLKRSDTYNDTDHQYHYPQSPAQVQLSLWPAGLSTNGEGTIAWAGGLVDWDSQYMQNGYYYAMVSDVSISCYDPPSGTDTSGDESYVYTGSPFTQSQVAITNNNTVLSSLIATGNDQTAGAAKASSGSKSQSSSAADASSAANSVPGVSGAGTASTGQSPVDNGGSSSDSGSSSGSGSTTLSTGSGSSSFSQGLDAEQQQSTTGNSAASSRVAGSLVAIVSVLVAAMLL